MTLAKSPTTLAQDDKLRGADLMLQAYHAYDSDSLKNRLIGFAQPSILVEVYQTYPYLSALDDPAIFSPQHHAHYETQCHDNLYRHLRYLQHEFVGQSELAFYHTLLIVLIRRGYEPLQTFTLFETLWQQQSDYLFEHLSLRWLVSAADTFIDFSDNPLRCAILMNVVSLINTLKVYETQLGLLTENTQPLAPKVDRLYAKHQGLYDGLTFFRLGSDDSLAQMRRRYARFAEQDEFATRFLLVIFVRLHHVPSAFSLIKQFHNPAWAYWAS